MKEGWRKILATVLALLLESGAFVLMVFRADAGSYVAIFGAYVGAITATLSAFIAGNVISKKVDLG